MSTTTTHGWTADGFEGVRDAFESNFDQGLEVGAGFSAYHRGQKVVDLWGGVADQATGKPWDEDALSLVFSSTKGITSICANKLVQEGQIDVAAPVHTYWPEFAQHGKGDMPVEYLLSHEAGLAWVDDTLTSQEMYDWEPVIDALERQAPAWEPGTQHGYHATTFGWLVGEIIRRVTDKSVGTYLRDEIADPLGLDLWIGLPEAHHDRVTTLISMLPPGMTRADLENPSEDNPVAQLVAAFLGPDTMLGKSLFAPGGAIEDFDQFNSPDLWTAEIPAANGITDARSLARLYSACVNEVDGIRILTPGQLDDAVTQRTSGPNKVLMDMDIQFGLGFMLRSSMIALGGPRSFGHFGAGGSMGWADPDAELAFGYVMNRMDLGLSGDQRTNKLVEACYASLS